MLELLVKTTPAPVFEPDPVFAMGYDAIEDRLIPCWSVWSEQQEMGGIEPTRHRYVLACLAHGVQPDWS